MSDPQNLNKGSPGSFKQPTQTVENSLVPATSNPPNAAPRGLVSAAGSASQSPPLQLGNTFPSPPAVLGQGASDCCGMPVSISVTGGGSGTGIGAVIYWATGMTWAQVLAKIPPVASGTGALVIVDSDPASTFTMDVPANLDNVLFLGSGSGISSVFPTINIVAPFKLLGSKLTVLGGLTIFTDTTLLNGAKASIMIGINVTLAPFKVGSPPAFVITAGGQIDIIINGGSLNTLSVSSPIVQLGDLANGTILISDFGRVLGNNVFVMDAGGHTATLFPTVDGASTSTANCYGTGITVEYTLSGNDYFAPLPNVGTQTGNYSAQFGDFVLYDSTAGSFNITLPDATLNPGAQIGVKNVTPLVGGVNPVTVNTTAGQTIDELPQFVMNKQKQFQRFVSDGSNWMVA